MSTLPVSSETVENIGWTLVHFLWQGTALALLLYVFVAFTRNAALRYRAASVTLLLMSIAPLVTYSLLAGSHREPSHSNLREVFCELYPVAESTGANKLFNAPVAHSLLALNWMQCLCGIWLLGVAVFSLRALGGFMVLRRLLRDKREPFGRELRESCLALQRRLGITRTIEYFHSCQVDAPAVVGWLQPVVLVPFSALTGMTAEQVEAVVLHELAHIKRWDCYVNLFQIAVETVLFYHPGVWWVSRFMRNERENCCDDIAVAACGNPAAYAKALTAMETLRQTPAMILAANAGSLKSRVSRVLGMDVLRRGVPQNGLAVVLCICLAGALLSARTVQEALLPHNGASQVQTRDDGTTSQIPITPPTPITPAVPGVAPVPHLKLKVAVAARPVVKLSGFAKAVGTPVLPEPPATPMLSRVIAPDIQDVQDTPPPPVDEKDATSYIGDLQSAGLKDLTVDNLIALKVQGITPDYVKAMRAAGFDGSVGQLIAMKVQNVSPDYVRKVRESGWKDASFGEILAMRVQGVDPAEAGQFRREFGFDNFSLGQVIAFKVQGITPEYVRSLRAAGIKDLQPGQIIAAKVQGITPQFVEKLRSQGFTNLSLHQLIGLKVAGLF